MRTDLHGWHICRTFWVCRERVSTCSEKCILCRDRIAKFGRTTCDHRVRPRHISNFRIYKPIQYCKWIAVLVTFWYFLCPSRRPAKRTAKVRQPDQSRHKNIPGHIWCTILDNLYQAPPFWSLLCLGPRHSRLQRWALRKNMEKSVTWETWEIGEAELPASRQLHPGTAKVPPPLQRMPSKLTWRCWSVGNIGPPKCGNYFPVYHTVTWHSPCNWRFLYWLDGVLKVGKRECINSNGSNLS